MTWLQRYRTRHYVRHSIWIPPVGAILAGMVLVCLVSWADEAYSLHSSLDADTARAVLGTMAASMFTFVVFVCSALLVAVQLASAQLTPRIIALVFREPVMKYSLALFVFTFTVSLGGLVRISNRVPLVTAYTAAYSGLLSLAVFIYLIDHIGKFLRPSGATRTVGGLGREVILDVYPRRFTDVVVQLPPELNGYLKGEPAAVLASPVKGVVLAFDIPGLVKLAQREECVIEMVPQVGDFVALGDPLFRMYHGKRPLPAAELCQSIAVGQERTLEQDPTFAFRIIVDIASKGLSPAINDPTTAVLALDQIHHLLRCVGNRQLDDGHVRDADGRLRLVYRTPDWEDFVALAVTEIRQFGGASIQVARRMRAMLENLIQTLPEKRTELLRRELKLLHRSVERFFPEAEDRALADVSDAQGMGGKRGQNQETVCNLG
jgi:uncharacterized membrane protein